MKIIFFGSDEFSLAALQACMKSQHEISLIITTPPQKRGRGLMVSETLVHQEARKHGLTVLAPADLKDPAIVEVVKKAEPDLFVVSSYGKFIPALYLGFPRVAALNVHPSLLPKYRGSTPIQSVLLSGDMKTGVSIIDLASKLDAGDIYVQESIEIHPSDDYPALLDRLAELSARMLQQLLTRLEQGKVNRWPQDEKQATMTKKITKEDALISFEETAVVLSRKVRAFRPWPGTYISYDQTRLAILDLVPEESPDSVKPGTITDITQDGALIVSTAQGLVKILKVQLAGKTAVSGKDFANGRRLKPGFNFSS